MELVHAKKRRSFQWGWNRNESFLWNIADLIINNNLNKRIKEIKEGDLVRYNWLAKVQIKSAIEEDVNDLLVVLKVETRTIDYINTRSGKLDSCDQAWLRHAKFWEY